jgi:hypothetical protein
MEQARSWPPPSSIHGTFPWAQRLLQKLTGKACEQWAGDRDDEGGNRSNGKLIEDLIGRAPITSKPLRISRQRLAAR